MRKEYMVFAGLLLPIGSLLLAVWGVRMAGGIGAGMIIAGIIIVFVEVSKEILQTRRMRP